MSAKHLGVTSPPCLSAAVCLSPSPSCLLPTTAAHLPPSPCVVLALLWCLMWLPLRPLPLPPLAQPSGRRRIVDELLCHRRT
jgi:hypothetical protein